MNRYSSTQAADRVPDDVAGAPCRWSQGDPWLGIVRTTRAAIAADVRLIVPHEGGAMAVALFRALHQPEPATFESFGNALAGYANLADFGVSARLTSGAELLLFRAAPSKALRFDDSVIPWTGGVAVAVRIATELREAVARAVHATEWPPWAPPALARSRTEAR